VPGGPGGRAGGWGRDAPFRFGVGIEDTFVATEEPGRRKLDEYELTQHYQFWERDLALVAASGADTLRWGIPWYRVEPSPGRFQWDWVDRVVDAIAGHGLTCVVDLMHYGTPLWLDNSFLHPDYPKRVAEYAAAAASRYGATLTAWTPLNEPVINAIYCGERGAWPPHHRGQTGFVSLITALAEGICRTQAAIASVQPQATFVHVDAGFRWAGDPPRVAGAPDLALLGERRFLGLDLPMGRVDGGHPLHDWLLLHGATESRLSWLRDHAVEPDVVGVNYYPAFTTVAYDEGPRGELVERPVEAGAAGLADLVGEYARRYAVPLMITETSRGGPEQERERWLAESLECVAQLRREGLPLIGYTWFPFLALVDWLYRESSAPLEHWLVQMGLVDLALLPGSSVLERRPTGLVEQFAAAARAGMPPIAQAAAHTTTPHPRPEEHEETR
jgi:hypothetical protein